MKAITCLGDRKHQLFSVLLLIAVQVLAPSHARAQTFGDVPVEFWAFDFIESLAASGITGGCGNGNYCPIDPVSRSQMAVFLERGMRGSNFSPAPATGTVFGDVSSGSFAAAFIEQLAADGITGGCGNGDYCPDDLVTRAQMAVFLLRAKHGAAFAPPPAVGVFADVAVGSFAADWIEQLAAEGVTSGCSGGNYCPETPVNRDQMAVFLVRVFDLPPPVSQYADAIAVTAVGSFGLSPENEELEPSRLSQVADFNGDGFDDLVLGVAPINNHLFNQRSANPIRFLLNNGAGDYVPASGMGNANVTGTSPLMLQPPSSLFTRQFYS